jgi:hypothetical protein
LATQLIRGKIGLGRVIEVLDAADIKIAHPVAMVLT